jgi:hypothetical protein
MYSILDKGGKPRSVEIQKEKLKKSLEVQNVLGLIIR